MCLSLGVARVLAKRRVERGVYRCNRPKMHRKGFINIMTWSLRSGTLGVEGHAAPREPLCQPEGHAARAGGRRVRCVGTEGGRGRDLSFGIRGS